MAELPQASPFSGIGHRFALGLFSGVIAVWLAIMAGLVWRAELADTQSGTMITVFEPGTKADDAFASITRAEAKPLRQTSFGFIWVVDGNAGKLKAQGAIGNYRELPFSPEIAGCVAVVNTKVAGALGL